MAISCFRDGDRILTNAELVSSARFAKRSYVDTQLSGIGSFDAYWLTQIPEFRRDFVVIPLWVPLLLSVLPTAVVWWRYRTRRTPDACPSCGYDLTGNESGRCPECGAAVSFCRHSANETVV